MLSASPQLVSGSQVLLRTPPSVSSVRGNNEAVSLSTRATLSQLGRSAGPTQKCLEASVSASGNQGHNLTLKSVIISMQTDDFVALELAA